MSVPEYKIPKGNYLTKAREAREALSIKSLEIIEAYISLASEAKAAGEFEVAADILWKLIDHMPRVEGVGIIDSAASKPVEVSGPKGPQIQIGVMLGGMQQPVKQLETSVIDVSPLEVQPDDKVKKKSS